MPRPHHDDRQAAIPTYSMADIAFLLIIFFMVTAVFAATKGLELKLPDEAPPESEPIEAVVIRVDPDGLEIDCKPVDLEDVLPYLEPLLSGNPEKPVVLYTHPEADYRDMVRVYDRLASTREPGSPWGFRVRRISLPTRTDLEAYAAMFGENPFEADCD